MEYNVYDPEPSENNCISFCSNCFQYLENYVDDESFFDGQSQFCPSCAGIHDKQVSSLPLQNNGDCLGISWQPEEPVPSNCLPCNAVYGFISNPITKAEPEQPTLVAPEINSIQQKENHLPESQPTQSLKLYSRNKATSDRTYTGELIQMIIDLARECGIAIPRDHKFSKKQPKGKEHLSKKGLLQKVLEWIQISKGAMKLYNDTRRECENYEQLRIDNIRLQHENEQLRVEIENLRNTIKVKKRFSLMGI